MNFSQRLHRLVTLAQLIILMLMIVIGAVLINLLGINLLGDISRWSQWLATHQLYFFIWRLGLYAVMIYGWFRMRKTQQQKESSTHSGLRYAEIAAVISLIVLESSHWLR